MHPPPPGPWLQIREKQQQPPDFSSKQPSGKSISLVSNRGQGGGRLRSRRRCAGSDGGTRQPTAAIVHGVIATGLDRMGRLTGALAQVRPRRP